MCDPMWDARKLATSRMIERIKNQTKKWEEWKTEDKGFAFADRKQDQDNMEINGSG